MDKTELKKLISHSVSDKIEKAKRLNQKELYLDQSLLTSFPQEIFEIKDLAVLHLNNNRIDKIPPEIEKIENLKVLDLSTNNIKEIPSEIGRLHKLRVLDLRGNKISRLPKEIRYLHNLKKLILSENNFKKFPKIIKQLPNLQILILSSNKIKELPSKIVILNKLKTLDLSYNSLRKFSSDLLNLKNLTELNLKFNPLEKPPPEIIFSGLDAIKNYFIELQAEEEDYLYEIKLLLVGWGGVGKTSLVKTLTIPGYTLKNESTTKGIDVMTWNIPGEEINLSKDFKINIWDFGGQEIYHSTHQFFLTKRSVYLLVTESRKEDRHEDFYYWLNIIKVLGDKSPVVIVLNKCDEPTKDLPIKEYSKTFDNIVDFKKISCMPLYEDTIATLKAEIKRIITNKNLLPHIGTPLPKIWVDIRMELEKLKKSNYNYISYNKYLDICAQFGMNEERALWLSQFFHDLGVILHFQDDIILRNTIVLNHEWVTKGVYAVLDNQTVIDNNGIFYDKDLIHIWSEEKYKDKQGELLALMKNKKFA